jgi:hypothetical protein
MRGNAFERHIYFWLGAESTQDERGVAAYKTVELDESLGGEPTQHREVQEHESAGFKALFNNLMFVALPPQLQPQPQPLPLPQPKPQLPDVVQPLIDPTSNIAN